MLVKIISINKQVLSMLLLKLSLDKFNTVTTVSRIKMNDDVKKIMNLDRFWLFALTDENKPVMRNTPYK